MSNQATVYVQGRRQVTQLKTQLAESEQARQKAVDDYLDLEQMQSLERIARRRESPAPCRARRPRRAAPKTLSPLVAPGVISSALLVICQQSQALGLMSSQLAVPGIAISLIVLSFTAGMALERMK